MLQKLNNKNNPEISFLIQALNAVKISYTIFAYDKVASRFQKPERVFTAELYHQLRKKQDESITEQLNINQEVTKMVGFSINDFTINAEPNKQSISAKNGLNECLGTIDYKRLSPDIVLHKNQNNFERINQRLICEIKMSGSSQSNIYKDFRKLLFYKLSRLQFQNAVFIYAGTTDSLKNIIEGLNYTSKENQSLLKCLKKHQIIFVVPEKLNDSKEFYHWETYEIK